MKLRPYQQAAIDALYKHLAEKPDKNPCITLPESIAQIAAQVGAEAPADSLNEPHPESGLSERQCQHGLDALAGWEELPPSLRDATRGLVVEAILDGVALERVLRRWQAEG